MYTIYLDDGTCIYDTSIQTETCKLISPTLNLSDNDAGELSFTILPSNPGYDLINKFSTTVTVYRDNVWLWAGRVLNESTDFYKQKSVTCEGVLAFLNDTHQESIKYTNITIETFITNMLSVHNQKVGNDRKIYAGTITVTDGTKDRYSEYEVTLDALNDLITDNEGHMYISYTNSKYYLNYVSDYHNASEQYIEFGKNLLDYTVEANMDNFASVILPLGKEDENTGDRLTVASVNQGSIYVADADAVAQFGWIEKLYDDSEISNATTLLTNAQKLLAESKIEDITISLSAVDLHVLDNNIQSINLLDRVYVRSSYHGVSDFYPVTELSYNLADPSGDTFTLGKSEARSLTTRSDAINEAIYKKINEAVPDEYDILRKAQQNATALITQSTSGWVTIVQKNGHAAEIVISEIEDYTQAERLWRWNSGGFGYSSTGYDGTYGTAITMDGSIVADFITAGTMSANRISGGQITSLNNNTSWNLNTGEFSMNKGEIKLGTRSSTNYYTDLNNLYIDDDGNIYTTGNIILASPESEHDTGWMAFGKTGRSKQVESMFGIYYEHGSFNFFGADTVDDLSPYRDGYIRGLGGVGTNQAGLELRCEPGKNTTWTYGKLNFVCGKLSLTGEDSSHNSVSGNGYTGSKVIDGVTYNFINGILLE